MYDLDIPSSGRFTDEDLRLLWLAGQDLASWRSRRAISSAAGSYARPQLDGPAETLADWHALEICAAEAIRLLAGWPTVMARELRWLPIGVGGGYEDLGYTERGAARVGYVASGPEGLVASRSARWFGTREPMVLATASTLAAEVASLTRAALGRDSTAIQSLLQPLDQVAATGVSAAALADPDPSSWPVPFVRFVSACMRVLTQLRAHERGHGAVPLLDTDELFEAWLAVSVRDAIGQRLDPAPLTSDGALASWLDGEVTVDLRIKPAISRRTPIGADTYRALVAQTLVPDLVVSATRGGCTELAVLDAKAWAAMLPEDVLAESAKYLYGIRRLGADEDPAVASVTLVSCAPPVKLHDSNRAHIEFIHARPTSGGNELRAVVGRVLCDLEDALRCRAVGARFEVQDVSTGR